MDSSYMDSSCKIWVSSTIGVQGLVVRSGLAMQKRAPYNQQNQNDMI